MDVRADMSAAVASTHGSPSRCVICGDGSSGMLRCDACGLALRRDADGVWITDGEPEKVEYPETGAELMMRIEDSSFWFQHRNLVLSALLDAHAPGATLVDVGGGNGFQALHLQRAGRPVVMVEPGATGCRNAARRGVRNVVRASLEALKLADGVVPAVSLLDVVEHLPDPAPLLAETRRVLRPGGKLLVTVPAYRALWSDEDVYAQHQRRYTKALLRRELEAAGFRVDYVGYYFQFLALPVLLLRALPYRLMPWRKSNPGETDAGEHVPSPTSRRWVDRFLARELAAIRNGRALAFGSSVLAVASRPVEGTAP